MSKKFIAYMFIFMGVMVLCPGGLAERPANELETQFENLQRDIKRRKHIMQHSGQVFNRQALILESDHDPLDVVLGRTGALLNDLLVNGATGKLAAMQKQLNKLKRQSGKIDIQKSEERFELYKKACNLRRKIAFSNPLLDFDKMLFITRHRSGFNHMCDQYYGVNTKPGGGLNVLCDPFGESPKVRDILAGAVVEKGRLRGKRLEGGSFLSPDLSYDGKTIVFGYVECVGSTEHVHHVDPSRGHWDRGRCYHVFKVNIDGTALEQLTDGTWNDFDPCWLPNGRIAFISERRGGYLRCGRVCPTYTLYDMNADGSDIRCLSPHETNEWHPSVTHDGMIIYTRWDYVDRHGCTAHQPWTTSPDGRDSRSVHGNFAPRNARPDMELDVRAIPGSRKFVA
ncbi:MAG: PD40 domain-containing protein, partial [Deltaproteobacteria bacterium]|nr:PD40 domain-containing protein [Deltaproteobacteria bacterium]